MGGWTRGSRALRLPSTAHDMEGASDVKGAEDDARDACGSARRGARAAAASSSDESLSVL